MRKSPAGDRQRGNEETCASRFTHSSIVSEAKKSNKRCVISSRKSTKGAPLLADRNNFCERSEKSSPLVAVEGGSEI